jgi:hypothetical protein
VGTPGRLKVLSYVLRSGAAAWVAWWPLPAHAQEATAPRPEPAVPERRKESTREILRNVATRHEELARLLDSSQYGAAFFNGAQAEFLAPAVGVASLLFGYDAVFLQIEANFGLSLGGDPLANTNAAHTYSSGLRLSVPVHRGVRADYAIMIGGDVDVVNPPRGSTFTLGTVLAGARMRAFEGPNIALVGTLGFAAIIRGEHSEFIVGARPLGSAAFVYFFR